MQAGEGQAFHQQLAERVLPEPTDYRLQELVPPIAERQGQSIYVHTGATAQAPNVLPERLNVEDMMPPGEMAMQNEGRRRRGRWPDDGSLA